MPGYAKQRATWLDFPATTTPILATNLNALETAIYDLKYLTYNVKDYGGVGDGVTNDTTAVTNTDANTGLKLLPTGTYLTTIDPTTLNGPFQGRGQIKDNAGHKRAPWFSAVKSAPSSLGDWGSVVTAFDGDLSKMQIAMEHRVTGSTTLGQPATGYVQSPECSPIGINVYNDSGWNQNLGNGDNGRTGLAAISASMFQAGMGDAVCFSGGAFANGQKPGYTHFGANSAAVLFNGTVKAGATAVYLNPVEINLDDGGYDVAGIGNVINLLRTNETGATGTLWGGVRVQNGGTKASDVCFMALQASVSDGFKVGLDLSNAGLATTGTWVSAAITLKGDQRIYLNASGTDAAVGMYRRPDSTGNTYIQYSTGASALQMIVGGTNAMQFAAGGNICVVDLIMSDTRNFQFNTTTGTKLGTATNQKLAFYNSTPVVQPSTTGTATGFTAGAGTAVNDASTFTGAVGSTAYRISDIVKHLKNLGLIAA